MEKRTLHCIYVAEPSENNFITGLNKGIWGLKKLNKNSSDFKIDDYLLFAHKISGKIRQKFSGQLTQYVLAKITSNVFTVSEKQDENNPPIWQDEVETNLYLNRFNFKILNSYPSLKINSGSYQLNKNPFDIVDDIESTKIYEALRYSACVQGTNGCVDRISLKINENKIKSVLLKNPSNIFDLKDALLVQDTKKSTVYKNYKPSKKVIEIEQGVEAEITNDLDKIQQSKILSETEKMSLVSARIGQGQFRKDLIKNFKSTCLLTGIQHPSLLVASHIKSWKECENNSERLDSINGLLLSSLMDKLFDRYFITFDPDSLRLVCCNDPLIHKIIVDYQLTDFILKVPYKSENLNKFKTYMEYHFSKFRELNEKRYG